MSEELARQVASAVEPMQHTPIKSDLQLSLTEAEVEMLKDQLEWVLDVERGYPEAQSVLQKLQGERSRQRSTIEEGVLR